MLNFFRGGPLDGLAYTTSTLLDTSSESSTQWAKQLLDYTWTPEVILSPTTGASARVWVHASIPCVPERVPPKSSAVTGSPSPAPTKKGNNVAKKDDAVLTPLEERRKAGGFSRNQVAQQAGITVSKVYRIEKGGQRTTEEEIAAVTTALDELEAANAS